MNTIYVPLLQVDGDTVTFSFEMRSGREHNTPDKAMWGFLVTVRAQVQCSVDFNLVLTYIWLYLKDCIWYVQISASSFNQFLNDIVFKS